MHKSFLLILFIVFTFVSFACSCSSEKSQKEAGGENIQTTEGEKAGFSGFTIYENAENGFSMAYPPICHPQNDDAELEKSFRGKLFIGEGAMLSAQMRYEWASSISDGTEILKNEKSSTEYVVKSAEKEMVHNQRAIFKNGKIYQVDYSYPVSAREKHDKFVDEVLASLKVK